MARIFSPGFNTIARTTAFGLPVLVMVIVGAVRGWQDSSYITGVGRAVDQPVPFSHQHHVAGLGIDCRFCHTSVEDSSFANIPATETCMQCHSQIWTNAEMLEPVRESFRTGKRIEWTRVHDLPDFVYFNHSVHVAKGVACATCHGQVDQMPMMAKANSLYMQWCLECHRHPEEKIGPKGRVTDMAWNWDKAAKGQVAPPGIQSTKEATAALASAESAKAHEGVAPLNSQLLFEQYRVRTQGITNCSACHR